MMRSLCLCLLLTLAAAAADRRPHAYAVPVPGPVTLDGKLDDWDLSARFDASYEVSLAPNFTFSPAFMYDDQALYLSAHFVDPTPMVNAHDPAVEAKHGWAGDCLQVRLHSDPRAPYPLQASTFAKSPDPRICHLAIWYYTGGKQPVLTIEHSMTYADQQILAGKDAPVAFRADDDGQGYTLEARLPWTLLRAAENTPKAGDRITLTLQPLWGTADGRKHKITFNEVVNSAGFAFQMTDSWGQLILSPAGHLQLADTAAAANTPELTFALPLPDPQARVVSGRLVDADGQTVRALPVVERPAAATDRSVTVTWDGLDDRGRPVPAGRYTVKYLTHRGIGQEFVASLHNSGTPPWKTDDGRGAWGGDWSPPVAAASDGRRVYLGWGVCESGWSIIAVEPEFGDQPRKVWGQKLPHGEPVGPSLAAMATDGTHLFVACDGPAHKSDAPTAQAGVLVYRVTDGQRIAFPFGKNLLPVSEWPLSLAQPRKPLFERRRTHDFGPQVLTANLVGLAVAGDTLYASLRLENKVVALDWRTGETIREYAVNGPAGLAVRADGKVVVDAGSDLVLLDPATGPTVLAAGVLDNPWGLNLDRAGNICVSNCGAAMQVRVFDPAGKPLRTVGEAGGRHWIGDYQPNAMLMPAGLTVAPDGRLWVTENDDYPRRVSVWDAAGTLVGDFHGPSVPQNDRFVDQDRPELVNVHSTLYRLDYDTGKSTCLGTLWRPQYAGWTPIAGYGQACRFIFRTVNGRRYAILDHGYALRPGTIFKVVGNHLQPISSYGPGCGWPVNGPSLNGHAREVMTAPEAVLPPDQLAIIQDSRQGHTFLHGNQLWHQWIDTNDDGVIQPPEIEIRRIGWQDGFSPDWIDDDLTLWGAKGTKVFRVPVNEWTESGIPVYPDVDTLEPLFETRTRAGYCLVPAPDGQRVYTIEQEGGDRRQGAEYAAIACYDLTGKMLWEYARLWPCFALDAPFYKPGMVIGADKILGFAKLDNGTELMVWNGYHGQYSCLTTDGLWVHAFCEDLRYGGKASANTQFIENFTGYFFRHRDNGKTYLVGGDSDCRIWEVTGLDTIRTATTEIEITDADAARAAAPHTATNAAATLLVLPLVTGITIDGTDADWPAEPVQQLDADAGRRARIRLAYDTANLYACFAVDDDSPMRNAGTDPFALFKTGDTCDVMLATDPQVPADRQQPAPGDLRLLFSVMQAQPVAVVYVAKVAGKAPAPRGFTSPTGKEEFARVEVLDEAKVAVTRTAGGYVLEASVPLAAIGFAPRPGLTTRGDVGVLFSNAGGSVTVLRAYVANRQTAIIQDVPSEVRLQPGEWAPLTVR